MLYHETIALQEPSKIAYMEGLIDVLSEIFALTTTKIADAMLEHDIRSWNAFRVRVQRAAEEI